MLKRQLMWILCSRSANVSSVIFVLKICPFILSQDKSADKKVQTKGKRGAKGKQAEVANQEAKEDLPAENGETKNEEVGAFMCC